MATANFSCFTVHTEVGSWTGLVTYDVDSLQILSATVSNSTGEDHFLVVGDCPTQNLTAFESDAIPDGTIDQVLDLSSFDLHMGSTPRGPRPCVSSS